MDIFNIISGVCSIVGLLVSVFTASKVIKICHTQNCINKGKGNVYNGSYVGGNSINERNDKE